jgi:outer membrane autotransporter protein
VPFVGIYAALTGGGGFYADMQARWDFYQMNISEPTNGVFQQKFHGTGTSIAANAGYNVRLANNFFVEPSIGVVHSRTQLDNLALNSFALGGGVGAIRIPGTLAFNDIESTLGRAGVRVGTSFAAGGLTLSPYGVASVFHEFAGNTSSTYTSLCVVSGACAVTPGPEFTQAFSTTRVGTFGQYSLGIAGQVTNTGWLGYTRVDFRKGENIEGVSMNGGLRYQFSPSSRASVAAKF